MAASLLLIVAVIIPLPFARSMILASATLIVVPESTVAAQLVPLVIPAAAATNLMSAAVPVIVLTALAPTATVVAVSIASKFNAVAEPAVIVVV